MLILRLIDVRPMYGYELVQAIKRATGQTLDFGEGCIYPILHRLESLSLVIANREPVSGRSRVVYRLTVRGKKHLAERVACWRRIATAIDSALQGEGNGEPALA